MPTWAIHLATAKKVSEKINMDKNIFTFGNILPDIPNEYVVKEISHHLSHAITHFEIDVLVVEHMEKRYNLRNFAEKYKSKFSNPLMLGYYVHLLTDYFWNNKTYGEHGIYDEEKNRIGLILNNGERILCSKETARQTKVHDFRVFSKYIYDNGLADKLIYEENLQKYLKEIDWITLEESDIEKTIKYINDRCTGKAQVLENGESMQYKIYSKNEMLELIDISVEFILKMIKKHANDVLKNNEMRNQ